MLKDERLHPGTRIKILRKAMGLYQSEFAQSVGTTGANISIYESGKRYPSCEILIGIAATYGVSADWLLGLGGASPKCNDLTGD